MPKSVSKSAPSVTTIEAMPRKTRAGGKGAAKPTMQPPIPGNESDVQSDLGGLSKLELIVQDVNRAWGAVQVFERTIQGGRVGPQGTWTQLVKRFVHSSKDWKDIRDAYMATLRQRVRQECEQENPKPKGITDQDYVTMILSMVKARMSTPSVRVACSNFDVIGKFFRAESKRDGKVIPAGPGRERLLELLEGKGQEKVSFVGTLKGLREAIGPDGRGRKAGTPNVDKGKGAAEKPESVNAPSVKDVQANPHLARAEAQAVTLKQCLYFLKSVHPSRVNLAALVLALGNKCKESDDPEMIALGASLIDALDEGIESEADDDEEAAA